jgi:hypothetical protein
MNGRKLYNKTIISCIVRRDFGNVWFKNVDRRILERVVKLLLLPKYQPKRGGDLG